MITITVRGMEAVQAKLNKYQTKFPQAVKEGTNVWGRNLAKDMRIAVVNKRLIFEGKLLDSIRWTPRKSGGDLWMVQHGVMVDSMRPHFISLKRGKKITRWAKEKLPGYHGTGIFVRPHPFIDSIIMKDITKLLPTIDREIKIQTR